MPYKDPEENKRKRREYYMNNAERIKKNVRALARKKRHAFLELPEEEKKRLRDIRQDKKYKERLKYDYGMTVEDYEALSAYQGDCCAICKVPSLSLSQRLAVDHCHATGKVRGLLCKACNAALGLLKDSPEVLETAFKYLKEHK